MGASPPHDHPHVYLDMGHEAQIVCPYCSTLFVHDGALEGDRERPACLHLCRHGPARRAGGLTPASSMPRPGERVLIAGGGIGGLTAAIALGRRGIETEVLERSGFTEETGAGIQLGPNATRVLAALGVLESDRALRLRPEQIVIRDGLTGRKLTALPLGKIAEARYGAPYLTLHRADLHAGLRAAAESLTQVTLRPGFDVQPATRAGPMSWSAASTGAKPQARA